ncbi:hypothetical protein BANRA_02822 [Klebsiella pneumoniae]|nr:hypothetical protein BANRA_02822 [Klebsiella pneumoniae]
MTGECLCGKKTHPPILLFRINIIKSYPNREGSVFRIDIFETGHTDMPVETNRIAVRFKNYPISEYTIFITKFFNKIGKLFCAYKGQNFFIFDCYIICISLNESNALLLFV